MIDLDFLHYRSLVDALCYFAQDLGDGERSERTPNRNAPGSPAPVPRARALVVCPSSTPSCRTGVSLVGHRAIP